MGIARARGLFRSMLDRAGVAEEIGAENIFFTVSAGAQKFQQNGHGVRKASTI
jgi:hypothetical protein